MTGRAGACAAVDAARLQGRQATAAAAAARSPVAPRRPDGRVPPVRTQVQGAELVLGPADTAPGCARAWTREILREWRLAPLADDVVLVVCELVTNACRVSRVPARLPVRLVLTYDERQVVVFVRDFVSALPVPRHAAEDDENGRGLELVEASSGGWGWYPAADGRPGKVVWAVIHAEPYAADGSLRNSPDAMPP